MIRKIVHISEEKCNGCGACASACHEGAIGIVNGKATLLRDDYCDGMGDCLPECPTGAITFEEREAAAYDEAAVEANKKRKEAAAAAGTPEPSMLRNWPVQLKLAPVMASYYNGASLLLAADCSAYAYAAFHRDFVQGSVTVIGCPKLDSVDYSEKLTAILGANDVQDVTLVRMEVPCCGGLEMALKKALQACGKQIPLQVVTVSKDGRILE